MKHTYEVITVGGVTEDIFFTVDDYVMIQNQKDLLHKKLVAFEYGAKLGVPELTSAWGGGAANAAVTFSRLGFRTAIIAATTHDSRGRGLIHNLLKNRVKTKLMTIIPKVQSGLSLILVKPGNDHIIFTYRGANDQLTLLGHQQRALSKAKWVYLTSLSGSWKPLLQTVFAKAHKVAWNPGRQQIAAGLVALAPYLAKTDILICNKDEALELVLSTYKSKARPSAINTVSFLLRTLKKSVPGIVVITNGEQGTTAFDGKKIYQQKIVKAKKVIDTTGVGDAFGASFVAGLELYNGDIKKSLDLAAKNASAVVSKMGAQTGLLSRR